MGDTYAETAAYDKALELLLCVSAELAATEAGSPARAFVAPGAEVAWDECECGQLTVQTLQTYPSDRFPLQKLDGPFTRCAPKLTVVEYQITILRCISVQDDEGVAPPALNLQADARTDAIDRAAVRRGVLCCLTDPNPLVMSNFLLQQQLAVTSSGQCMGSELHVLVALNNCVAC